MKDILAALWTRFFKRASASQHLAALSFLFIAMTGVNAIVLHDMNKKLAFFEDLANRQAQQLAAKDVIDYHVDTTPFAIGDGKVVPPTAPIDVSAHVSSYDQMAAFAFNQFTIPEPVHHVKRKPKTLYQLCRANHGTRSQCKAESKPIVWPVVVGPAQVVPGDVTFIFHAGTAGGWKCPAHSPEPFPENCTFVPDYYDAYGYGHASDEGPMFATHEEEYIGSLATPAQQEDMELIGVGSAPLQTSGPMPVKACDGEHCEVVDGQWYPLDGKPSQVWQRETNQER